jgi:low molecular weight protein-tyrosine phosphatase
MEMVTRVDPIRLCFVCLGNICRSPTAEGIMRALIAQHGLDQAIVVESAGTGSWHLGERADARARATAEARGITLDRRAQQFASDDFDRFDYVFVADDTVRKALNRIARNDADREKIHLLRSFDPESPEGAGVPDPYYGEQDGFEDVFDICDAACRGLLDRLLETHALRDDRPAEARG